MFAFVMSKLGYSMHLFSYNFNRTFRRVTNVTQQDGQIQFAPNTYTSIMSIYVILLILISSHFPYRKRRTKNASWAKKQISRTWN